MRPVPAPLCGRPSSRNERRASNEGRPRRGARTFAAKLQALDW